MSIPLQCPDCGVPGCAADRAVGRKLKCPQCGHVFEVPQLPRPRFRAHDTPPRGTHSIAAGLVIATAAMLIAGVLILLFGLIFLAPRLNPGNQGVTQALSAWLRTETRVKPEVKPDPPSKPDEQPAPEPLQEPEPKSAPPSELKPAVEPMTPPMPPPAPPPQPSAEAVALYYGLASRLSFSYYLQESGTINPIVVPLPRWQAVFIPFVGD